MSHQKRFVTLTEFLSNKSEISLTFNKKACNIWSLKKENVRERKLPLECCSILKHKALDITAILQMCLRQNGENCESMIKKL